MSANTITFAPKELTVESRDDGSLILRSPIPWKPCESRVTDFLPHWANASPERIFLAQRNEAGAWDTITYRSAWAQVQAVGESLIDMGARPGDKLAVLSGNSIENAIVSFAAMAIGAIVAPISPNYSVMPGGLARLQDIATLLRPRFVFVQSAQFASGRTIPELASSIWISVAPLPDAVSFGSICDATNVEKFSAAAGGLYWLTERRSQYSSDDVEFATNG